MISNSIGKPLSSFISDTVALTRLSSANDAAARMVQNKSLFHNGVEE